MQVEVVRSSRRRKTVQASTSNGVVRVSIPDWMTAQEEDKWVQKMVARLDRTRQRRDAEATDSALQERAVALAERYGLPRARSVRWVDNQRSRWASCTPADGSIRLSSRLAQYPRWVTDYVLVHELAHLQVAGHSPQFWDLVNRYAKSERARGFLIAKGLEDDC